MEVNLKFIGSPNSLCIKQSYSTKSNPIYSYKHVRSAGVDVLPYGIAAGPLQYPTLPFLEITDRPLRLLSRKGRESLTLLHWWDHLLFLHLLLKVLPTSDPEHQLAMESLLIYPKQVQLPGGATLLALGIHRLLCAASSYLHLPTVLLYRHLHPSWVRNSELMTGTPHNTNCKMIPESSKQLPKPWLESIYGNTRGQLPRVDYPQTGISDFSGSTLTQGHCIGANRILQLLENKSLGLNLVHIAFIHWYEWLITCIISIESVRVITDDNPMPPGLHRKSLIVVTPGREIQFTAPTSWDVVHGMFLRTVSHRDHLLIGRTRHYPSYSLARSRRNHYPELKTTCPWVCNISTS